MSQNKRFQIIDVDPHVLQVVWFGDLTAMMPAADAEQIAVSIERSIGKSDQLKEIQFELNDCQSIDSRGIALLMFVRRHMARRVTQWRIVGAPARLSRMLELLNLQNVFVVDHRARQRMMLLNDSELPHSSDDVYDPFTVEDEASPGASIHEQRHLLHDGERRLDSISWDGLVASGDVGILAVDSDSGDEVLDQLIVPSTLAESHDDLGDSNSEILQSQENRNGQ